MIIKSLDIKLTVYLSDLAGFPVVKDTHISFTQNNICLFIYLCPTSLTNRDSNQLTSFSSLLYTQTRLWFRLEREYMTMAWTHPANSQGRLWIWIWVSQIIVQIITIQQWLSIISNSKTLLCLIFFLSSLQDSICSWSFSITKTICSTHTKFWKGKITQSRSLHCKSAV